MTTPQFQTSTKTRILTLSGLLVSSWLYPLHGKYLQDIKETLKKKRETAND